MEALCSIAAPTADAGRRERARAGCPYRAIDRSGTFSRPAFAFPACTYPGLVLLRVLPKGPVNRAHVIPGARGHRSHEIPIHSPELVRVRPRLLDAKRPERPIIQDRVLATVTEVQDHRCSRPAYA